MTTGSTVWLSLVRAVNRRTKNNRALRQAGIRTYASLARANKFLPPPKVLLNGPPKSGTHLLSDCVALMPKMLFSGRHFALTDFFDDPMASPGTDQEAPYPALKEARLATFLKRCPQGMFATAHARFHPVLRDLVKDLGFKHVLLLRDPRDVVVSHAFYVKREPLHFHHGYFTKTLGSDEERIMASIRGFGVGVDEEDGRPLLPIGESYAGFISWTEDPHTLVIRFEDLIGPRGGGDGEVQLDAIEELGNFVGRPLSRQQAREIAEKMYGKGSLTFRKGQAGDWRNHFTQAHRQAFKEEANDVLIKLGYEQDPDW